jgi:hypothetical protein
MSKIEFVRVLLFFILITLSSTLLGLQIINVIKRFKTSKKKSSELIPVEQIGAGLLIGIGIVAYASLIVGFAGFFKKETLLIIIIGSLLISSKQILPLAKSLISHLKNLVQEYKHNLVALAAIVLCIITLGSLYLTAMQPPYTSDELHYHLPEVKQIVETQKIDLKFGGHPFYGNIPKLMEIVFAIGSTLSSYQLSHALNFMVFLGFIVVVFGFVIKYYGVKTASFSILLLSWFDDLTWNATSGFIDAATTSFEISALLFILDWTVKKSRLSFFISAALIGIAASMKYSPLPTATFILGIIVFDTLRNNQKNISKILKNLIPYILIALLFGGFWYIKNLIILENPFYPLYFGHRGYDEAQFKSLVDAIHEFGPKTFAYFFKSTIHFLTTNGFFVFISIYIFPTILFIRNGNKFKYTLFLYVLTYTLYWFFFATHQIRFLSTALVVSIIILSIITSKIKYRYFVVIAAIVMSIALYYSNFVRHIDFGAVWNGFWNTKFHYVERQYGLGNISEREYLKRQFGCQYSVIKYLEDNNLKGSVIDNWSVWFAPSVSFYATGNTFRSYAAPKDLPTNKILNDVERQQIKYIYFDSKVKSNYLKSTDSLVIQSKNVKLPYEEYLLKRSEIIYFRY